MFLNRVRISLLRQFVFARQEIHSFNNQLARFRVGLVGGRIPVEEFPTCLVQTFNEPCIACKTPRHNH